MVKLSVASLASQAFLNTVQRWRAVPDVLIAPISPIAPIAVLLLCALLLYPTPDATARINIFADTTTYSSNEGTVELKGNVEVFDHRFVVKGDRAKITLDNSGIQGSAQGNITYSDRWGNIGIADAVDIDDKTGKFIKLIGNVTIWHGSSYVVSGDVIYHYYEENRTVIESNNGSVATLKSSDGLQSLRRDGDRISGEGTNGKK